MTENQKAAIREGVRTIKFGKWKKIMKKYPELFKDEDYTKVLNWANHRGKEALLGDDPNYGEKKKYFTIEEMRALKEGIENEKYKKKVIKDGIEKYVIKWTKIVNDYPILKNRGLNSAKISMLMKTDRWKDFM